MPGFKDSPRVASGKVRVNQEENSIFSNLLQISTYVIWGVQSAKNRSENVIFSNLL